MDEPEDSSACLNDRDNENYRRLDLDPVCRCLLQLDGCWLQFLWDMEGSNCPRKISQLLVVIKFRILFHLSNCVVLIMRVSLKIPLGGIPSFEAM